MLEVAIALIVLLAFDLYIVLKTISTVIERKGAY